MVFIYAYSLILTLCDFGAAGLLKFNHDKIGKVHSRAIPVSWKVPRVFSTGSQDSPPVSLVSEAHRLSGVGENGVNMDTGHIGQRP